MNAPKIFRYDQFMSLSGDDLTKYVEPFVYLEMHLIPESVYDPLQSALGRIDEMHTVYALEICSILKPREFARRAVDFLAHSNPSVCCAASNALNRVAPEEMPADLVKTISVTPVVDLVTSHVRTGERIRVGTNEAFIRDLVERYSKNGRGGIAEGE